MHACMRVLWLLLLLLVWCVCGVQADIFHARLHFELGSLAKSKYVAKYWRNVDSAEKGSALKSAVAMLTLPQEGLVKYYTVITKDSFYMDTEGVIRISVHDPIRYDVTALRQYIDGFIVPMDPRPSGVTATDAKKVTLTGKRSDDPDGVIEEKIMSNAATYFFLNQPMLHCIYNAPTITRNLITKMIPARFKEPGDATNVSAESDSGTALLQGKTSSSSSSSESSTMSGSSDRTSSSSDDDSADSSSSSVVPAENMSNCLNYMPPLSSLRPPNPKELITKEFMRRSALLLLKVFDADVWVKLTHPGASGSTYTTRETDFTRNNKDKKTKEKEDDETVNSKSSEANNDGEDDDTDEITVDYNPVVDTAKLCSAPALYTISLGSLYNALERRRARRAARAAAMNARFGYDDPNDGDDDDNDNDDDGDNDNDDDDIMIELTHIYQPVRMVVVVIQCSAVPLHLNLTVELVNSNGQELSGQYFTLQKVTIVFLVFYSLLFITFLVLLLPLPCWRQKRATSIQNARRHQRSASNIGDAAIAGEAAATTSTAGAQERGFAQADYVTALYRDEAATTSNSHTRSASHTASAENAVPDMHHTPLPQPRRSARRTDNQTHFAVHHHNDNEEAHSSSSDSSIREEGWSEGLRLSAVMRDIRRSCRVVRHWWAAHEMIFMYTPLQVLLGILLPLKCLTCAMSVVSVSAARRDSLSSGMVWQFTVNVINVVLNTALFTLEMLVAMGWAVAYEGGLPTVKTVTVGVCTTIALVLHILALFCPDSIDIAAFTANKSSRAMMSLPCRMVNYVKVSYGIIIHLYNLYELMRLTCSLGRQCAQMSTTALTTHKSMHSQLVSASNSGEDNDTTIDASSDSSDSGEDRGVHGRRQRGYCPSTGVAQSSVRRRRRTKGQRTSTQPHNSNSDNDEEHENVSGEEGERVDTPLRRTSNAAPHSTTAHHHHQKQQRDYRHRHELRGTAHHCRRQISNTHTHGGTRGSLSSSSCPHTSSKHRTSLMNSNTSSAVPHARWHVRHSLPSHRLAHNRLSSASERRARVAVQVSRHGTNNDNATRRAAALRASADEAQLTYMELFLRYHSMTAPFAFISLMSLLYVILSLSFYQPEDRYMMVAFEELLTFYLMAWTLVFLRKRPYVY